MAYTVVLSGGTPWGFRLQGGKEFEEEFTIAKINPNSKAYVEGIQVGDYVDRINGDPTHGLMHNEALQLIRNASDKLELELRRGSLSNTSNTLPRAKSRLNGDVNHNLPGYWSGDEGEQEGDLRQVNYKPVSFGTSPRSGSNALPTAPTHQQQSMDLGARGLMRPQTPPPPRGPQTRATPPSPRTQRQPPATLPRNYNFQPPRLQQPRKMQAPPGSPGGKSKGLALFLKRQKKCTDADDEIQRFRDTDEPSRPAPSGPPVDLESKGRVEPTAAIKALRVNSEQADLSQPLPISNSTLSPAAPASHSAQNPGVWSPDYKPDFLKKGQSQREEIQDDMYEDRRTDTPLIWSPVGRPTSPRKGYRPVRMDRQTDGLEKTSNFKPEGAFGLKPMEYTTTATSTVTTSTMTTMTPSLSASTSPTWNGTISHFSETRSGLPTPQSPTITLLQKSRDEQSRNEAPAPGMSSLMVTEGALPRGALYMGTKETVDGDVKHTDTYYMTPGEKTTTTTTIEKKAPRVSGVGPRDNDTGMPVSLRMTVDEKNQKDWYKQMYKSLHTDHKPKEKDEAESSVDDSETNTYKPTYVFPDDDDLESEKEEANPYRPSYEFPNKRKDSGDTRSLDRYTVTGIGKKGNWSPPHARYRNEVYKNQPLSITEYEPGYSSIAFKENKSQLYNPPIEKPGQYSKYILKEHQSEPDIRKTNRPVSPEVDTKQAYRTIQSGGEIPISGLRLPYPERRERHGSTSPSPTGRSMHHSASDITSYGSSPGNTTMDRKRRDEEAARRKAQMDRIYMEQKQRRMQEEEAANAARRHNDVYLDDEEYWLRFTGVLEDDKAKPNKLDPTKLDIKILDTSKDRPQQKSPIPPPDQRFEEVDAMSLQRPQKKAGYTPKGKAVSLYNFSAQNPKELSFKKGDTLYLLRQIDQNWYEGEHHGRVGIFPANYIKVITSLETAHAAAFSREGTATAKYNFTAQTSVELPLRKGELVQLIRRVDDNWYEGRTGNRQGIFPVAYVDIVKEPDTPFGTPMSSVAHTPMTGSPGPLSPVSTISNGPAPTIPDAPDSPRSFDLSRSYGLVSSQSNRSVSPSSQLSQRQDYRPKSSASNLYGSYNGSSSSAYPHPQQQDYSSSQYRSSPKDTSSYGYRDDAPRSYGMTNGGSGGGTYATVGSRDSYSSSRGYREEEPKYPKYRAIYRYLPQNEDELELNESDVIYVMEKCDDGWYVGLSARTKEFGTFPGNYVQPI